MSMQAVLSEQQFLDFLLQHKLPSAYRSAAEDSFLPLAHKLTELEPKNGPRLIGINGAQGTGKSTLADFLRLATNALFNWNVAVLSIDDFYYTQSERRALAKDVHPLLATRGVPGTHDNAMLNKCIHQLRHVKKHDSILLPRFDKSIDDRTEITTWPIARGAIDLIILEGWCVGSKAQPESSLDEPVNVLERDEDTDGAWRRYVNNQLRDRYQSIFSQLDILVLLQAPNFDAILRWRLEQEEKLAAKSTTNTSRIMSKNQLVRFIQHYERITQANLETLRLSAHAVFELNSAHSVEKSVLRFP